jgi:hypothetical protein
MHNTYINGNFPFPPSKSRFTSCQMSLYSDSWRWRLFWGLVDIALTNSFAICRMRNPKLQHSHFYRQLCIELFHKATKTPMPSERGERQSTRTTPGSSASPYQLDSSDSEQPDSDAEEVKLPTDVHEFARFRGTYKRSCFYCKTEHVCSLGGVRNKAGLQRKEYPRSHTGCKTCNVALCTKGECWSKYHRKYCGKNDGTDPTGSFWAT